MTDTAIVEAEQRPAPAKSKPSLETGSKVAPSSAATISAAVRSTWS